MTAALPRPLEPWAPWLALLAPDLAVPLGQLLLQLHPLVGRMHAAAPSPDALPAGVGSIVQRGSYERLLISEWSYADAAPDEFIRRAAGNELLFTGPEPQRQHGASRCIALFDAGPAQLGEPRLAQLALFILLARRAAASGAEFAWGVLQRPGELHQDSDLRALLDARTLLRVDGNAIAAWERWHEQQDDPECWQLGAAGTPVMRHARAHVTIDPGLLDDGLALVLHQDRSVRTVTLALPAAPVSVRLLRNPFENAATVRPRSRIDTPLRLRPSAMQPPRFGPGSQYVAAARVGGGMVLYHVPSSNAAAPGVPRWQDDVYPAGSVLGVVVLKKSCATVSASAGKITFTGFPGLLFRMPWKAERPPMAQFRAPSGAGRWLPTFYLAESSAADKVRRILMVDSEKRLVCWAFRSQPRPKMAFSVVADVVIGIAQFGSTLVYACAVDAGIDVFRWDASRDQPVLVNSIGDGSTQVCFDGTFGAKAVFSEWLAWKTARGVWQLPQRGVVDVPEGAIVLGLAAVREGGTTRDGLVVLARDRRSIRLHTGTDTVVLVHGEAVIAQAALDAAGERLAWILDGSREFCVRHLRQGQLLLRAVNKGDDNGA